VKHSCRQLALVLICGLIINVAVAWGGAVMESTGEVRSGLGLAAIPMGSTHGPILLQAGLPWRSLEGQLQSDHGGVVKGIVSVQLQRNNHVHLPCIPVWPGFVLNVLLYSMVVGLISFATSRSRQILRRRRNLCPACAYPCGTNQVCTECGQSLRSNG
jgi:hypothetical protein